MPAHTLPELADVAMVLSFFALLFVATNLLARAKGHRD